MIELNKVSKSFKRTRVLNKLELSIDAGERIALVGSNGAGKTTLIRCLLGEYACDGSVLIDGLAPRLQREKVLARVGFVPQLPPPLKMSVWQLIHFAAAVSHCQAELVEVIARRLGFDVNEFRYRPFTKLSGGQKQKLLIAIALGRHCDLLIMDEPAANLDPLARQQFFELLAERQDNTTMLISSHRLDEVASLVNRVIELDQGRVSLDDSVADNVALSSRLLCHLTFKRAEPAVTRSLGQWHFRDIGGERQWQGYVAGPDRLRFLSLLSRYAGLLESVSLEEVPRKADEPDPPATHRSVATETRYISN